VPTYAFAENGRDASSIDSCLASAVGAFSEWRVIRPEQSAGCANQRDADCARMWIVGAWRYPFQIPRWAINGAFRDAHDSELSEAGFGRGLKYTRRT